MTEFETNFIVNMITLRRAADLSQKELAAEVGVNREKVRNWENYKCFPSLQEALFIAAFFQLTAAQMGEDIITQRVAA